MIIPFLITHGCRFYKLGGGGGARKVHHGHDINIIAQDLNDCTVAILHPFMYSRQFITLL